MKRRSDPTESWDALREKIIGLGEQSLRKNHYPELQRRLRDLERFRALLDASNDCIFLARFPSYALVDVNELACLQVGYSREELLCASLEDLMPPSESDRLKDLLACRESGCRGMQIAATLCRQDRSTIPVEMDIRVVELTDAAYIVAVVRDITERTRIEQELRSYREHLEELVRERTVRLEEKNRILNEEIRERKKAEEEKARIEAQLLQSQKIEALGAFAGGIAHDLNNILSPIIINTELLLDETDEGSTLHEILRQNLQAAYRQKDLVKQILSFSRQGTPKLFPTRVRPLLEDTLDFIRCTLPSTIVMLRSIDAPDDLVMCDPTQIQQVVMNLCKNAADALEAQRGTIEVRLADVHLEPDPGRPEAAGGEYLELTVRDTGHGIPEEIAGRIFDPFFTTKDVGKGSGMGLSVVHGILKKHGGFIKVESPQGKGACFTVDLPLFDQDADAREADSASLRSRQ